MTAEAERRANRPVATVSVDLDPIDMHLIGYGHQGLPPDPLVYTTAVPRLLERFADHGVRATFFIVGRDAEVQASAIAAIASAGHEVASHSLSHPMALASLDPDAMRYELTESRRRLEPSTGTPVVGYRSPNFDMTQRAFEVLASAGYAYDASAYPSPLLIPARLLLALKSTHLMDVLRLRMWPFTWRREPHDRTGPGWSIREFPLAVTPVLRWPIYHTLRYGTSDAGFARTLDGFARREESLSYVLHAVDVLGFEEDRIDRRLSRHPGMETSRERKLALLSATLSAIAQRFTAIPFRDRLVRPSPVTEPTTRAHSS
jgi:peptidoglycan/xylan/chitin deacetylase (PgdA/CDA1 family)